MSFTITDTLANCFLGTTEVSLNVYAFSESQFGGVAPAQYTVPPTAQATATVAANGSGVFVLTVPTDSHYHLAAQSVLSPGTWYWTYSHATDQGNVGVIDTTTSAHLVGGAQTIPTIAVGAGAGTAPPTPTLLAGSTDLRGQAKYGTGTSVATGAQVVVTFTKAFATAPEVALTPMNAATAALELYATATTTTLTINATVAPTASQGATTYVVDYVAIG